MIVIREERGEDIPGIRKVHQLAFPTPGEARLVYLLRQARKILISYVAVEGDTIVGHVLYSPIIVGSLSETANGIGLAPVAVLPEYQGKGIGSQLIRESLQAALQDGYGFVVLLGNPGYYSRFGFRRALDYGLENEYGVDEEFMVLELSPGALEKTRGQVKYAPEFQESGV